MEIEPLCLAHQIRLGYDDPQIFWEATVAGYQKDVTRMNAISALLGDYQQTSEGASDDSEIPLLNLKLLEIARANATIVWNDEDLEALYEEAKVARASELRKSE